MAKLYLNLKGIYFDQIKEGTKTHEYRVAAKWRKRLEGKTFEQVVLMRGYPKRGDTERIIERPWRGFTVEEITHPHFGADPVEVCAIVVN